MSELTATTTRRAQCAQCLRPQTTCICAWVQTITPQVEVLILQHPLEVHNAKGSARLLHLSLERSVLVTGEQFAVPELQALLYGSAADARQPLLLYPDLPLLTGLTDTAAATPDAAIPDCTGLLPSQLRLVVLDATWRKSRKMLHLNPLLQRLPRLPLRDPPPSLYRIRKAHRPDQLSTLEATCYALMQLEQRVADYQPVLQAFDGFVQEQLTRVGERAVHAERVEKND